MTGRRRDDKEKSDEEEYNDGDSKKNEAGKITFRNAPEFRRDFIEFCLEEVNNAGQMGSALKIPSWERIGEKLSAKYGPMTNKKLRNHWDYLKKQYVAWSTIISMTGHEGYNAETNTFNWPKEQWDEISKKVKNANQFKEKGLEDAELLKSLFGGKIQNGDISLTMGRPRRIANVNVPLLAGTPAPVGTLEESEPTRLIDRDPYFQDVSVEDTRDTSASRPPMKQKKRKRYYWNHKLHHAMEKGNSCCFSIMMVPNSIVVLIAINIIIVIRIFYVIHQSSKPLRNLSLEPVSTLIILGSGGHTAEMLNLIRGLQKNRFTPRVYVAASTDNMSLQKAQVLEASVVDQTGAGKVKEAAQFMQIYRSREVGQSYLTSVGTTLIALVHALFLMMKIRPQVILCNGPGTCFPLCVIAFLFKVLGVRWSSIFYVESIARVRRLSLSGLLLYKLRIADLIFVQWPQLQRKYPRTNYVGCLM